ncbi:uncharacterized protein LOC133805522 [Humulus lupulus]|uniref:uncharacterized protein LOC133805522 n=1 Tax=Humulus lupulus TaxID=3486 RepID=UPI002B403471|nr:uncharacterized protein LOC133805522 [Humulus lupulus]
MDFQGMKRKELQALCKTHGIPANLTNREMADRLNLLLKEGETSVPEGLCEIDSEVHSVVVGKKVKKVTFSPENETFVFVGTDVDSNSDSDYSSRPKKGNSRKRRSTSKNVVVKMNVKENPVRVTRARAQSDVEEDLKAVSLAVAGRKRGRKGKETVDVCDKPAPVVDDSTGRDEPKKEEGVRQLRGRNVVIEADGNGEEGDVAVPSKKKSLGGSKKTRGGKGSNGFLSADVTLEENLIAEAANPQKIMKRSHLNESKDEDSNALSQDLGKTDVGIRTRRSKTQMIVAKDEGSNALTEDLGKAVVEGRTRRSKTQMNVAKDEGSNGLTEDLGKADVEGRTRRSKIQRNVAKDEDSNALTKDLGNADVGVRTRRTRTQINENDFAETKNECQNVLQLEEPLKGPARRTKTQRKVVVDEGSKALTDDLAKAGVEGRTRRSRAQINGNGVFEETKKSCQDVLQLEEPSKGLGRNSLRRKSVAGKKGRVASETFAGESIEHGPMLNMEPSKRSKKTKVDDVPKIEPNGDTVKQLLPDGPSRRTRRNTILFSSAASTTTDEQLTTRETAGRVNLSIEEPLERCANVAAKPARKSTRDASSQILTEISDKLGEVARKYGQEKKTQELVLNEQSLVIAHEPVNTSKGKIVELVELTTAVLKKNKQHEERKQGDGLFSNDALPLKEPPVIDDESINALPLMESPVIDDGSNNALPPKQGDGLFSNDALPLKEPPVIDDESINALPLMESPVIDDGSNNALPLKEPPVIDDESNNALPLKESPVIDDELAVVEASISRNEPGFVEVSAVNDELVDVSRSLVVDISPNLVVDLALSMESQVSASVVDNSAAEHVVNGNENNTAEEGKEKFLEKIVESDMEDQSLNASGDPGDYKLVLTEYPNNEHLDSTVNDLSPIYDEDSEGGYKSMNQGSDEVDNQSAENDKANNIQEDQYLADLNPNENLEPIQDHVNDSQEEKVGTIIGTTCLECNIEQGVLKEEVEPGFLPHFPLEKLPEGRECESPSAINEIASIKEESNEDGQIQQPYLGELDNHKDVASELNRDPSFSAHDLISMADQVNVEDEREELGGKKCESPSNSNEEAHTTCEVIKEESNDVASDFSRDPSVSSHDFIPTADQVNLEEKIDKLEGKKCQSSINLNEMAPLSCEVIKEVSNEVMHTVQEIQQPHSELDNHVALELDTGASPAAQNLMFENDKVEVEVKLEELQEEQKCGSPKGCPSSVLNVYSSHGDEYRSHNSSGDTVYTTDEEAEIEDSGNGATNGKNQENDAATSEFYQARANYHDAAAKDFALVTDVDCKIEEAVENSQNVDWFTPLPDNTTSELPVQSSEITDLEINLDLADEVLVEANLEGEYDEKRNEVEEILAMTEQVDETSELQVQSSETTASETIMGLGVGEKEGVERSFEVLVEANLEEYDEKHCEVEENLAMNEQVDETSELQVQSSEIAASETIMDLGDSEKEGVERSYEALVEANLEGEDDEKRNEVEENLAMNEQIDETSELQVQSSEITASETIMDLGDGEKEGVERSYEALVEANLEGEDDEKRNEVEENLAMNEQVDESSELHVQPSEITASETIMGLGVEGSYEVHVEANLEGGYDEKHKEIEEKLTMNEQVEEVSERQLGEHGHHTSPAVSEELISEDSGNPNEREDAFAIIQEYLDNEVHMDLVHEESEPGVAENKGCESGAVEGAETSGVAEQNMLKDGGEEDKEAYAETTLNEDLALGATASDINDNLVEDEVQAQNDSGPDSILINSRDIKVVSTDEACDESLDQRIDFDSIQDSTKLAGASPISPQKFEDDCGCNEKIIADIKTLAETTIDITLTVGEESPCHVYRNLVTDSVEVVEANTDRGSDLKNVNLSIKGNEEFGTDRTASRYHRTTLEGDETDDVCLGLSNLFSSNSRKIDSEKTWDMHDLHCTENVESSSASKDTDALEELSTLKTEKDRRGSGICLDLHNLFSSNDSKISSEEVYVEVLENVEVSFGGSKDSADVEEILAPERDDQQCLDDCSDTAQFSQLMQLTPQENKALECKTFECDNLMGEASEEVKNGEDTVVSISKVSASVVEVKIQNESHFAALHEPINENERSKQSVITQCLDLDICNAESFEFKESTEIIGSITAFTNTGGEDINSVDVSDRSVDMVETREVIEDVSEGNMTAASDEPSSENGGSAEKGLFSAELGADGLKQVENENVAEGVIDASEDMVDTAELSNESETQATSSYAAASDEPSSENGGSVEKGIFSAELGADGLKQVENENVAEGVNDVSEDLIDTAELSNVSETQATSSYAAALDEPIIENGGSVEKGIFSAELGADENENVAEGVNDASGDMVDTAELSNVSETQATSSYAAALDEPIIENNVTEEKCNIGFEHDEDESAVFESSIEADEVDGFSSAASFKPTTEGNRNYSKQVEICVNKGGDSELKGTNVDQFSSALRNVSSKSRLLKLESLQETGKEGTSDSAIPKNNIFSIPATPKNQKNFHDMKENMPSSKREHFSLTASKRSQKRRPLENLPNM